MARRTPHVLREMYDRLFAAYGSQHWWPGETALEVVVGAILAQNTAWTNVERAIANLRCAGLLDWNRLCAMPEERLAELIRPAGTFRIKANRLKAFVEVLFGDHAGSLDTMLAGDLDDARSRLLSIRGVGPETADAILLYAGGRPTFVVDAYTKRVLRRHVIIDDHADYESVRQVFHKSLEPDTSMFNEFHALFVAVGKRHCRSRTRCEDCPLAPMPHDASA